MMRPRGLKAWLMESTPTAAMTAMMCVALAIRLVVVACAFRGIASPENHYGDFGAEMGWVARSLVLGQGFSSPFYPQTGATALVPPLFPFVLAAVFKLFGLYTAKAAIAMLTIQSVCSALTCVPVYMTLREAAGERQARLGGWLWAVYPFAINYAAAEVWDYALTSLLFAWCFYWAQRLPREKRLLPWAGFGVLYGVAALSNPSVLSMLPFLLLLILWQRWRAGNAWLGRALLTTAAVAMVLMPWTLRNERALHQHIPMRDGFWLEFYAGNHGDISTSNPPDAHPATNAVEMQAFIHEGETGYLNRMHVQSIGYVKAHPVWFAGVSLRRFFRFWTGVWSFMPWYMRTQPLDIPNFFFCTAVTVLMVRGVRRWWKRDATAVMPYVIAIAVFPLPYYVTHASMDYRQPIEPIVIMLAAVGILGWVRKATTTS